MKNNDPNQANQETTQPRRLRVAPASDSHRTSVIQGGCPFPDSRCSRKPQNSVPLLNPGEIQNEIRPQKNNRFWRTISLDILRYLELLISRELLQTTEPGYRWLLTGVGKFRIASSSSSKCSAKQEDLSQTKLLPVLNGIMTPPN